ncbi:serine/threonine-protein kinase 11-interacting protein, partial [Clarias magur]
DLCKPVLVRVLSEIEISEDFNRMKESELLFLRVHQSHILEVDMHQGCIRRRFELDSLRKVITSQATWTDK